MEQNLDDLEKLAELKEKGIITEEEFRKKKEHLLQLSPNQEGKPQQSEEKTVKGEKWYQKPLGIIVLLFLFFPVGLYLMWKYSNWSKNIKLGVTGFFAFILIVSALPYLLLFLIPIGIYLMWRYTNWNKKIKWAITALPVAVIVLVLVLVAIIPTPATPVITLSDFEVGKTVTGSEYNLSGKVDPPSSKLKVNGQTVEVKEDGGFTYSLSLEEGVNEIKIEATNYGKTVELSRRLTRELTEEEKAAKAAEEKRKAEEEAKKKAEEEAQKKADDAAKAADKSPSPTKTKDKPAPSSETVSQKNAVAKAKSYLEYTAFSHDGLVDQLEYEQFSHADAVYGTDKSGANWNEQAAKKAKDYMEYSSFSRGSLIEQLKYEKFTQAQAEYGANAVGL